jgi:ParB family transcriptional regulator, chromosome partitioning protein
MAKRKRLELPAETDAGLTETKSAFPGLSRMPIAEVAGDTSARAALDEVSRAMTSAEAEGRMVRRLPIDRIDLKHLNRDRMVLDPEEMATLKASLQARGQQTPIEVLQLSSGRFGLISGLRRLEALREMEEEHVLAFVRRPESAAASYVAMVEENEIRAALSFYERANIAVQAVGAGVYRDAQEAVKGLFANVSPAKRSKILRFVLLRQVLGKALRFPAAIPEKLGLALATAVEADKALATRIKDALRKTPPADAAAERRVLERALKGPGAPASKGEEVAPGVTLKAAKGRVTLSGRGVDAALTAALRDWLAAR